MGAFFDWVLTFGCGGFIIYLLELVGGLIMFVDRLTDEECLEIMNKLLGLHYNKAFAQFIVNESEIIRKEGLVRLSFPCLDLCNGPRPKEYIKNHGIRMEDRCQLTEYSARIFISGEQPVCVNEANTLYRTNMYNKFGDVYLNNLEKYLIGCAEAQYRKTLNNIDTELYNIRGERLPLSHEYIED